MKKFLVCILYGKMLQRLKRYRPGLRNHLIAANGLHKHLCHGKRPDVRYLRYALRKTRGSLPLHERWELFSLLRHSSDIRYCFTSHFYWTTFFHPWKPVLSLSKTQFTALSKDASHCVIRRFKSLRYQKTQVTASFVFHQSTVDV